VGRRRRRHRRPRPRRVRVKPERRDHALERHTRACTYAVRRRGRFRRGDRVTGWSVSFGARTRRTWRAPCSAVESRSGGWRLPRARRPDPATDFDAFRARAPRSKKSFAVGGVDPIDMRFDSRAVREAALKEAKRAQFKAQLDEQVALKKRAAEERARRERMDRVFFRRGKKTFLRTAAAERDCRTIRRYSRRLPASPCRAYPAAASTRATASTPRRWRARAEGPPPFTSGGATRLASRGTAARKSPTAVNSRASPRAAAGSWTRAPWTPRRLAGVSSWLTWTRRCARSASRSVCRSCARSWRMPRSSAASRR
jgi:hypothetical protein